MLTFFFFYPNLNFNMQFLKFPCTGHINELVYPVCAPLEHCYCITVLKDNFVRFAQFFQHLLSSTGTSPSSMH